MKHPQLIVAFDKGQFGELKDGLNTMDHDALLSRSESAFTIKRREELETDERYGQMLPYIVLFQDLPDGKLGVFTYRRTKGVGESRLVGNASVGLGGHVDIGDVVFMDNILQMKATIGYSMERELREEVLFSDEFGVPLEDCILAPFFVGVINDTSNPVGRVHYGFYFGIDVPAGVKITTKESELVTVGVLDIDTIEESAGAPFENWSQIVIQHMRQKRAEFKKLGG